MTSPFLDAMGLGHGAQRRSIGIYLATALIAGALIALQITVMRIFSVGSWAHFGSLVISLAMLGFVIGLGTELLTGQGILGQLGLG